MNYLGIDPGKQGGIALVNGEGRMSVCCRTPLLGKEYEVVVELAELAPDEQPTKSTDAHINARTNRLMAVSLASDPV